MLYIFFFFAVVLPISLWLYFIVRADRSEPEPRKLLRRCFYVGMGAAVAAFIFEIILFTLFDLPSNVFSGGQIVPILFAALLVGPAEEFLKYAVLRLSVYLSNDFNQIFDGVVYGITVALGFSFAENTFYFFSLYNNNAIGVFAASVIVRGLFTTFLHTAPTGTMGYFIGKAKFANTNKLFLIAEGVTLASAMHILINFLLAGVPYGLYIGFFLIVGYFFIFMRIWKRPDVQMIRQNIPLPPY